MVCRPLPATSRRRAVAVALLKRLLDLDHEQVQDPLFQHRATAFFFQRVAGRPVAVTIGGRRFDAGTTDRVGHFSAALDLDDAIVGPTPGVRPEGNTAWFACTVEELGRTDGPDDLDAANPEARVAVGRIHAVEPEGLSIISDIDDTVKDSNVIDKRELLANTFAREFRPLPDMVAAFQRFQESGAAFHYVSASPWQLANCLRDFFDQAGLPPGSMHLKLFRLKDSTPLGRFPSRKRSKRRAIERIMADFPGRRFLLVGDSGELDPEVYAAVARRHPSQVAGIAIRQVQEGDAGHAVRHRIERLSRRMPDGLVQVFTDAADLAVPS